MLGSRELIPGSVSKAAYSADVADNAAVDIIVRLDATTIRQDCKRRIVLSADLTIVASSEADTNNPTMLSHYAA